MAKHFKFDQLLMIILVLFIVVNDTKRILCTQSKVQIDFIGHAIYVGRWYHIQTHLCGFVIYYLLQTLIFATLFFH